MRAKAEVTDIAYACLQDVDAVMLSEETAVGEYPLQAVTAMDRVLREIEAYQWRHGGKATHRRLPLVKETYHAIPGATSKLAEDLPVCAIVALTGTGRTARNHAAARPFAPILALAREEKVVRQLNLVWGVTPYRLDRGLSFEEYVQYAEELVRQERLGKRGEYVVLLSRLPYNDISTNSIFLHRLS